MAAELRDGVVAMIDALGFRGIWTRFEGTIMHTLEALHAEADARAEDGGVRVNIFSDTILIASSPPPGDADLHASLRAVLRVVEGLWHTAVMASPPLLFRGCISTGKILVSERSVVGEAVDEAAGLMEAADCALVWFAPGAGDDWHDWGFARDVLTFPYAIPLRDGRRLQARTLNPCARFHLVEGGLANAGPDFQRFRERVAETFHVHSPGKLPADVAIKKQNTHAFIVAAWAYLLDTLRLEQAKIDESMRRLRERERALDPATGT